MSITKLLEYEEGFREKPYYCSEGYPTIGIGTKIGTKNAPLEYFVLEVDRQVAWVLLEKEVSYLMRILEKNEVYNSLNSDRKTILLSMAYQLGINGLFGFKKMWAALLVADYSLAAKEALDSKWAKQTPQRAHRHAKVLETGDLRSVYTY